MTSVLFRGLSKIAHVPRLPILLAVLLFCVSLASADAATNPMVVGNARFTVVTPLCIRLEYAPDGKFVDAPSLFAAGRAARFDGFRLTQAGGKTTIDTGTIRLTYTPDGKPFSADNLQADIHHGTVTAHWTPGMPNPGNLGGTIRTLDGADGPEDLGQGLISRDGWYLLDDSRTPLQTSDWVQSRPAGAGTDWYLFGYGDDYKAALRSLTVIGGPVPLPRKYALGTWYSRYWPFSSSDYRQIVTEYGQHDFPLDNIVMDMDWHKDGWTGWSWNRKLLPDAEQLLQWDHQQGLHVTLNLHPADGVGPQEDQYAAFMKDMGADPATKQTLPFDAGSKRYMDALFKDVIDPLEAEGVDFWWLDWQQYPFTRSVPDLTNLFWLNTLLYDHTGDDGKRGMSFSRWAGWGDHRHPIHFSGDASTSFPMLAFEVPFTSTAGNVGCFFWSHDIGGHNRGRNEESYTRWVQFGATSPVLRSHSTRDATMDRRPWTYPKWAEDSMRVSFHLRDALFPYIYSSAWETTHDSVPLDRPLYIDYPDTDAAYHNAQEYLFGDALLAAPVVTPGIGPGRVGHQTVWFPPSADWYNYFTGERYVGGADALVSADINEFPLFVRGGIPIPMQDYAPRMATTPLSTLRLRCYPGADGQEGTFTLYEDDGETTGYQHGASATTPLSYVRHGNTITVTVGAAQGHYAGQVTQRGIVLELPDTMRATMATVNGKPTTVTYEGGVKLTNTITVPAQSVTRTTTITVLAAPAGTDGPDAAAFWRRLEGILGNFSYTGRSDQKNVLAAALAWTTDPAQREELLAAAGVGLVHHNMAPYLYGGTVRDEFYAPAGLLDGNAVTLGPKGNLTQVRTGRLIDAAGAVRTFRGRTLYAPGQVTFQLAGQTFHLPAVPPVGWDLLSEDNVALDAKVTVSGVEQGYGFAGATDGIVGGYPANGSQEWSSGATTGGSLTLTWDTPQTIDRILLYDRPNMTDQITAGQIKFSDGSTLAVGTLPNDAATPFELRFPPKTVTSLTFTVTGVTPATESAGLAEIAVFRAGAAH
jgi:alpha-glucosidase (family GH31 glycosyl hydrolase)